MLTSTLPLVAASAGPASTSVVKRRPGCFTERDHASISFSGSWIDRQSMPYNFSCPFMRPWENCAYDDRQRAEVIGRRRFEPQECKLRHGKAFVLSFIKRFGGNRTIFFYGESVAVQQFVSLACTVHAAAPESWLMGRPGRGGVATKLFGWKAPKVLTKRCHGERLCHYQNACTRFALGRSRLRICVCSIVVLEADAYRRCLRSNHPSPRDVVVYGSIGVHYTGEGDLHQDNRNITQLAGSEVGLLLSELGFHQREGRTGSSASWYASDRSPMVFWREVLPQHFPAPGGHYWHGLSPPGSHYNVKRDVPGQCDSSHTLSEMYAHHRWNNVTLPIVERTPGVQVMRVFRASAFAWDTHLTFGDCTHWCQPGVPDHWTELLLNSLMAGSSADDG